MSEGLGGGRLKKLFRNSKAPGIDPLPIPDTLPSQPNNHQSPPSQRNLDHGSGGGVGGVGGGGGGGPGSAGRRRHLHHHHAKGSVTPFPMDVGRDSTNQTSGAPPPPVVPPPPQQQQPGGNGPGAGGGGSGGGASMPAPRPSRDLRGPPPPNQAPTLAEIQAMEEAGAYARESTDVPIYQERSRRGTASSIPSVDAWAASVQPPPRGQHPNGPPDQAFPSPYASQQPSPQTQPNFYLPPGAGPPSPKFGSSTPPPGRMSHVSQNSLSGTTPLPPPVTSAAYGGDIDGYASGGRSRGYSSASQSGRGSDQEGSVNHHLGPTQMGGMLNKPVPHGQAKGSPLVQSYSSDLSTKPQPPIPDAPANQYEKPQDKAEKKSFWKWGERKHKDKDKYRDKDKEKYKADKEPGQNERVSPPFVQQHQYGSTEDVLRPSVEDRREGSIHGGSLHHGNAGSLHHGNAGMPQGNAGSVHHGNNGSFQQHGRPASTHGHGSSSGHGAPIIKRHDAPDPPPDNDVSTAVRNLCATRETTFPHVLDLCERINKSDQSEVIGREAARSLRKVFKGGADNERRMAARVWLITMGNVFAKDYRRHATSRKMFSALEPILKQEAKPTVSPATYKTTKEILSGITYTYHSNRSCEGLLDFWKKVKAPGDPEFGTPLPDNYLPITPETKRERKDERNELQRPLPAVAQRSPQPSPAPSVLSRPPSEPMSRGVHGARPPGSPKIGVPYSALPDHEEDIRRLLDECNRALQTAHKLAEACSLTQVEHFEADGGLHDLQRECLRKQEALTSQIGWAQSEAEKSRRIANSIPRSENGTLATQEEGALELLFKAHHQLTESLHQYEDLAEECQMREVQERSKQDTRMDRRQQMDMLSAPVGEAAATSSRSPSPSHFSKALPAENGRAHRAPGSHSSHGHGGPVDGLSTQMAGTHMEPSRSRTPSPSRLPAPPKIGQSPPRAWSPLGRARVPGPRPLPNPGAQFKSANSHQNLVSAGGDGHGGHHHVRDPKRDGSGSTLDGLQSGGSGADGGDEDENGAPMRPSRKALGKRRAVPDDDNDFDPNDLFNVGGPKKPDADSDSHSITADDVYLSKPIVYAYDAWAEAMQHEREEAAAKAATAASAVRSSPKTPTVTAPTPPAVSAR